MDNHRRLTLGLLAALVLPACDNSSLTQYLPAKLTQSPRLSNPLQHLRAGKKISITGQDRKMPEKKLAKSDFQTIEWTDLMPKEDLDALLNPPDYLSDIEDGSFEDQINNQFQSSIPAAGNDPYQQALVSTRIVPEMDGKPI